MPNQFQISISQYSGSSFRARRGLSGSNLILRTDEGGLLTMSNSLPVGIVGNLEGTASYAVMSGGAVGASVWGGITGSISAQTDLQSSLAAKQSTGNYITALTGDVAASGPGNSSVTIGENKVTLAMMSQVSTSRLIGRASTGTGNVESLTASQTKSLLAIVASDIADLYYVHNQGAPSSTWNIGHNLSRFPSVTMVDSANTVVIGDVNYTDVNNLVITLSSAFAGKAFLN